MSTCGKGCMPECEYFTTAGCVSPFNCPHKIETSYINSATTFPEGEIRTMTDEELYEMMDDMVEFMNRIREINEKLACTISILHKRYLQGKRDKTHNKEKDNE